MKQVYLNSILRLWELILSILSLSHLFEYSKALKTPKILLAYFRDSLYSLYGKSCFPTLQFIEWKAKIKSNSILYSLHWVFQNSDSTLEFECQVWDGDIFGSSQYRYYLKSWNQERQTRDLGQIKEDKRQTLCPILCPHDTGHRRWEARETMKGKAVRQKEPKKRDIL